MKMMIREFASLTDVSVRTLRYYDEIGLLSPAHADLTSGYRYYDDQSLERMQRIMFYRGLGFPLKRIAQLLELPESCRKAALMEHKAMLEEKKKHIESLIAQIGGEEAEDKMQLEETKREASLTALMSAFARAYHCTNAKDPIFSDTKARELMTDEEYGRIAGYILGGLDFIAPDKKGKLSSADEMLRYLVNHQFAPTPLARAQYCESCIRTALLTGTKQIVILGAGMDTLSFRETQLADRFTVFEVDHPVTQADKRMRIARALWRIPAGLRFVGVDFAKDKLADKLIEAGFDPEKKTCFTWLGVSYYLTEDEISLLLESLARLSAEGSSLIFDFAGEGLFAAPQRRVQNMVAMAAAGGEPMKSSFSYAQLERLLGEHGFLIYERLAPQDIENRYFSGRTDGLHAFEHISYVTAVFKP